MNLPGSNLLSYIMLSSEVVQQCSTVVLNILTMKGAKSNKSRFIKAAGLS